MSLQNGLHSGMISRKFENYTLITKFYDILFSEVALCKEF